MIRRVTKKLTTNLLNFAATKAGSWLAVPLLGAIAGLATLIAKNIPWLYPVIDEPSEQLALAGVIMSGFMAGVNILTNTRAAKYAEPVQKLLAALADKLGLTPVLVDKVIAYKTAEAAKEIKSVLTLPGGEFNPNAEVRKGERYLP